MSTEKNINEQLKTKIDELDLDAKLSQLAEAAGAVLAQARVQAGSLVHENRAKVDEIIEKATATIDEKTEGKYHDKVAKAKASFAVGLDRIAEARDAGGAGSSGGFGTSDAAGSSDEWTVDEGTMHVGEEVPGEGSAEAAVPGSDSTVRPDSAPEADVTDHAEVRLTESAEEPGDPHDPQAWANETDRLS
ncbi:MAG: antitoxin [Dermatophilaceae bacterium]